MKKHVLAAAMVMAMGYSTQACATEPFVGVGVGSFNIGTGVTKKAAGGAYLQVGDDFAENLGGEVRIGASSKTGEEFVVQPRVKVDYFAAAFVKPKYQFNDAWTAYGLLGVATLKGSYSQTAMKNQSKTRSGVAYGAGVQFRFDQFAIGAEYTQMLSKPKATAATIGTNFKGVDAGVFSVNAKFYIY